MTVRFTVCIGLISLLLQIPLRGEGMIYQLPADGTWAEFAMEGIGINPDDTEVTISGTMRMSSVGTATIKKEKCRWIEFKTDGKRNNEKFTTITKLLIPKKHLKKGGEPLKHAVKGWESHSQIPGGPRAIDLKCVDCLESKWESEFLHGPYQTIRALKKKRLTTKLGELECEGITTTESTGGTKRTREIRRHEKAPFGVVSFKLDMQIMVKDETAGMSTSFLLSKTGGNAKSALPQSE